MPLLVVLLTKLPNACAETSFLPGASDCENAGSAIEAMLTNDVMTNFLLNISFLLCSTGHRLFFFMSPSVRPVQGTPYSNQSGSMNPCKWLVFVRKRCWNAVQVFGTCRD